MIKVFEYLYENKKYIAFINNGNIGFGISNNGYIETDISKKESFIIKSIYNFIAGDKKYIIELSHIKFNNRIFRTLYNTKNRLYSFLEISTNNDIQKDTTTLERLNYILNNQSEMLYKNDNSQRNSKIFNLFVKIGSAIVAVAISSSIILSTLPTVPNNEFVFKSDYLIDSLHMSSNTTENNKDFSIDEMLSVIENNQHLNGKEKQIISKIQTEIKENIDYIDAEQLITNLSELKIDYLPYYGDYIDGSDLRTSHIYPMAGAYFCNGEDKNTISLMGDEEYNTDAIDNADLTTLFHELNHLMTKRKFLMSIPGENGDIIDDILISLGLNDNQSKEMINELFTREYLGTFTNTIDSDGYNWLMPVAYSLCEIIDADTIRKYKFDSDPFYITNALNNIGLDLSDAHSLYMSLNLVDELMNAHGENAQAEYKDNNSRIYDIIKKSYELKYNKPMENDLILLAYFYNSDYVNEEFNERFKNVIECDEIVKINPKGYFSADYKQKHPSVTVEFIKDGKNMTMEIDDSNRYIISKDVDLER